MAQAAVTGAPLPTGGDVAKMAVANVVGVGAGAATATLAKRGPTELAIAMTGANDKLAAAAVGARVALGKTATVLLDAAASQGTVGILEAVQTTEHLTTCSSRSGDGKRC